MLDQISVRIARESLVSGLCPACGGRKKTRQTFCRTCYFKLPVPMRRATYALIGHGYQEAVVEAMNYLEVQTLHLPSAQQDPSSELNGLGSSTLGP